MFEFLKKTTLAAVAATSIAMMGTTGEAATFNGLNDIADGGSYDIYDGPFFFGVAFPNSDPATTYTFDFFNSSASSTTVGVTIGTVLQAFAHFVGGVTVAWTTGGSVTIPQGVTSTFQITTVLSALETDTLTLTFGDPVAPRNFEPGLQMAVAAIPLPAGGLLLLGALSGIAALRRRKTA